MAENIEVRRDTALEQRMLEAVIADRNDQPRSKQLQVGPSEVGGCRELLRAGLFESDTLAEPETHWATAAHVGTVMGADLERIFGQRLGALEQQRMTTTFENLGLRISGSVDLLFLDGNQISDLKSNADIGGVLYDLKKNAGLIETLLEIHREGLLYDKNIETPDGGYELTEVLISKISKLHYYVQLAIYVTGAIQTGVLEAGAEGRLVFYDRGGSFQEFIALVITADEIAMFYDIAQHRIDQVVEAQDAYERGEHPAIIAHLRDMAPSYCFSPKVMCPRRMHCWAGSEWTEDQRITAPDHIAAVERYVVGRDMAKLGDNMRRAAREQLKDVQGVLPDGRMVTWTRGGSAINVVETTAVEPKTMGAVLDEALAKMEVDGAERTEGDAEVPASVPKMRKHGRELGLSKMKVADLRALAEGDYDLSPSGRKADLIARILEHEADLPPMEPAPQAEDAPEPAAEAPDEVAPEPSPEPEPERRKSTVTFEPSETLQRRKELFGWSRTELVAHAKELGIDDASGRSITVDKILAAEGLMDPTSQRLRQMQYNADPVMRRNLEGEA